MAWVRFVREGKCIEVEDGSSVLEAEIRAGLRPDAPCGGQGKCGKCLVKLNGKIIKACQVKLNVDVKAEAGKEYLVETGKALYDENTKLWCNGPAYIAELYREELKKYGNQI